MRPEIIQFDRKRNKDAAPGEIHRILQITVPVIFQQAKDAVDGGRGPLPSRQILLLPDFSRLAQNGVKKILFALEIVVEPSLGDPGILEDIVQGSAQISLEGEEFEGIQNDLFFARHRKFRWETGIFTSRQTGRSVARRMIPASPKPVKLFFFPVPLTAFVFICVFGLECGTWSGGGQRRKSAEAPAGNSAFIAETRGFPQTEAEGPPPPQPEKIAASGFREARRCPRAPGASEISDPLMFSQN